MPKVKKTNDLKPRAEVEAIRRGEINDKIERVARVIPYLTSSSSLSGQDPKISKNIKLRVTTSYIHLLTSEKFQNYCKNFNPTTAKLVRFFNKVRADIKCSFFFCDFETKILFTHGDCFERLGYEATDIIGTRIDEYLLPDENSVNVFRSKLEEAQEKLLMTQDRTQYFEFTCFFLHFLKKRSTSFKPIPAISKSTQPRSKVRLYGHLIRSPDSVPQKYVKIGKQGNGHITTDVQNCPHKVKKVNDYPFFFFGQFEILPERVSVFTYSYLSIHKLEYKLLMDPYGNIFNADHRMVKVLGRCPSEVIGKKAHSFIVVEDLRLALYAHLKLFQRKIEFEETVHRLEDASGRKVYIASYGVLTADTQTRFELTARKLDEEEGEARRREELARLPFDIKNMPIEELRGKLTELVSATEPIHLPSLQFRQEQSTPSDSPRPTSLPLPSCEPILDTLSSNLIPNTEVQPIIPNQTTTSQNQSSSSPTTTCLPSSYSSSPSYVTIAPPQLLINSFNLNSHPQTQQPNQLQQQQQHQQLQLQLNQQHGLINNEGFIGYNQNQNQTHTTTLTMSNPPVYSYIPVTPMITSEQKMFTPTSPNQPQQIFNLPTPVPSSNPLVNNNNHVFVQNINISITNNNNYFMYNNTNGDHHLPTEGEGAFVNLIPFLENDAHHDLKLSK